MRSPFPPPPFFGPFVRRTAAVWVFFRVASVLGGAAMLKLFADLEVTASPAQPALGSYWVAAATWGLTAVVVLGDMARRSELIFLANLRLSARRLVLGSLIVCGALEAALRVALVW